MDIAKLYTTADPGERAMLEAELEEADIAFQVHEDTNIMTGMTVANFLVRREEYAAAERVLQSFVAGAGEPFDDPAAFRKERSRKVQELATQAGESIVSRYWLRVVLSVAAGVIAYAVARGL